MRALKHLGCNTQQGQFKHNSKRIRRTQLHTYAHTHTSGLISISFSTMTHLDAFSEVDVYRSMNCCLYEPSSSSTLAFRMGDALAAATGGGKSHRMAGRDTHTNIPHTWRSGSQHHKRPLGAAGMAVRNCSLHLDIGRGQLQRVRAILVAVLGELETVAHRTRNLPCLVRPMEDDLELAKG